MKRRASVMVERTWWNEKGEARERKFHASKQMNMYEKEWDASIGEEKKSVCDELFRRMLIYDHVLYFSYYWIYQY